MKKAKRTDRKTSPVTICGVSESPHVWPKLRRLNAAGKWPKAPRKVPTIAQLGKLLLEDAKKHGDLVEVQQCMEIMTGKDADHHDALASFARYQWRAQTGGVYACIPHGMDRKTVMECLEEMQRLIMNYWGGLLLDPGQMTAMVYKQTSAHADEQAKNPPPVVDDANPGTWSTERYDAAQEALKMAGMMYLCKLDQASREKWLNRWIGPSIRGDVIVWAATFVREMDERAAGKTGAQ